MPTNRIRRSRCVRPWKSSSNGKRPDHPISSHKNWSSKGGHVTISILTTAQTHQASLYTMDNDFQDLNDVELLTPS